MSRRQKRIGYWVIRVATDFRIALDKRTRALGIGPSDAILLRTLHDLGPSSLVELAQELDIPHPSIVRQIDALEEAGYAVRTQHPEDRRVKIVTLTREGIATQEKVAELMRDVHRQATEGLEAGDIEILTDTLRTLHRNLCDANRAFDDDSTTLPVSEGEED